MSGLGERLDEFAKAYQAGLSGSAATKRRTPNSRALRDAIVADYGPSLRDLRKRIKAYGHARERAGAAGERGDSDGAEERYDKADELLAKILADYRPPDWSVVAVDGLPTGECFCWAVVEGFDEVPLLHFKNGRFVTRRQVTQWIRASVPALPEGVTR